MFSKSDFKFIDDHHNIRYFTLYNYILITAKATGGERFDDYWFLEIYEDFPYLMSIDYNYDNIQIKESLAKQFNAFTFKTKRSFIESILTSEFSQNGKFLKITETLHA